MAEKWALDFLLAKGMTLICQNYRCPGGECDLMLQDKDEIVLVEVKFRSNQAYGTAIESITQKKLQSMERCIAHKYKENDQLPYYRFDVVAFDGKDGQYFQNVGF